MECLDQIRIEYLCGHPCGIHIDEIKSMASELVELRRQLLYISTSERKTKMIYILKKIDSGLYVALSGMERSYTKKLQEAATYSTKAGAEQNRCGNEVAVELNDAMYDQGVKR